MADGSGNMTGALSPERDYYHGDFLGSTILLTGRHGRDWQRYSYDAFGKHYEGSFERLNEVGYNGKRYEGRTGQYDYGYRDYDPRLGRFTTVDPIRDEANWYAYCGNDPVNYVDPWGLSAAEDREAGYEAARLMGERYNVMANKYRPEEPIDQNDPRLADIPNMASEGCKFRAAQNVAEQETGKNLFPSEIKRSVEVLQKTPNRANPDQMVVEKDMTVNNPDQVAEDAFDRLGSPDRRATFGWGDEGEEASYQEYRGETVKGNPHFKLNTPTGETVFDPYDPDLETTKKKNVDIYLH